MQGRLPYPGPSKLPQVGSPPLPMPPQQHQHQPHPGSGFQSSPQRPVLQPARSSEGHSQRMQPQQQQQQHHQQQHQQTEGVAGHLGAQHGHRGPPQFNDSARSRPVQQHGAPPQPGPDGHNLPPTYPAQYPSDSRPGQGSLPSNQRGISPLPPATGGNDAHLAEGMNRLNMQQTPTPSPLPHDDQSPAPARGKRSARAYHDPTQAPPASGPGYNQNGLSQDRYQQDHTQNSEQQQTHYNGDRRNAVHNDNATHRPSHEIPQGRAPEQDQAQLPPTQHLAEPGIPQPPHSAGQRIPGKMRVRIDPDHIPSPVAVQEVDQHLYHTEPYLTCSRTAAPLATTEFVAVDQGNCNPRFVRMTTYSLPHTDDLALASQLPLGLVIQPFASLREEEGKVPLVDFSESGPPRCQRCRGYINAWCNFIEGGQKFVCNLCGGSTDVSAEYFSHLDMSSRRMDLENRPELRFGSVDFVVGKDYWVQDKVLNQSNPVEVPRQPVPLNYIFAIDVSWTSGRCRLVHEVIAGLKELLYPSQASKGSSTEQVENASCGLPPGSKIAIMTFDRTVHFFNLKAELEQPQMLVVPDIDDMFLPLGEGFLVDPVESRSVIEALLETLPGLSAESSVVEAALGGPMRAAMMSLKTIGGQVNLFQASLPTIGPGALKHREDNKLYGTDKEKTLFIPQDPFYRTAAEECAEAGIGVNLFLFPTQYIDVASLSVLPGLTGGELFFHPRFEPVRDGRKLRAEIMRVAKRETGYSVTMRVRCSNGLRIADHFGNFFQRNVTDLEFGTLDADKAIAAKLKHEGKLDEKLDAHFQCAVLYTSAAGQRRVRVHNLAVPVTNLLANVFRFADMDTTLAYIAKECITQASSKPLRQVRDQLTELCVKALLAYRKHCASSTSPAQLILPESFKLFPLYALALMKTKALKGGPVASDVRTWSMRLIKSAGVAATVGLLYPRMLPVHNLAEDVGFPDESGRLKLPPLIRTSYARMEPNGAYLIENGEIAILWLGSSVSSQILQDLYAVDNLEDLDIRMATLPALPTRLSTQLRNILNLFEKQRGDRTLPVLIARQNVDGTEIEFSNMLVEDTNNEQFSYIDYLCFVHQQIQADLLGESKKSEWDASSSFTTW